MTGEGGEGKGRGSRIDTAVDERRNEMVDRVARYGFDYEVSIAGE